MKVLFNPTQPNYNKQRNVKHQSFKAQARIPLSSLEEFFVDKFNIPIHAGTGAPNLMVFGVCFGVREILNN